MTQSRQSLAAHGVHYCRICAIGVGALCAAVASAPAQVVQRPVAIQNARILTMDGAVIDNGTLVIKGDRIVALGSEVNLPLLAQKINARGGTITPGLIDAHSALGRASAGSGSAVRKAEDAFDRYDTADLVEALRHGVTALYVSPGSSAGTCGTGTIVRLAPQSEGSERIGRVLKNEAALGISLGSASAPIARLKTFAAAHKQFRDALEHQQSLEDYEEDVAEYEKRLKEWIAKQEKEKSEKKKQNGEEDKEKGERDEKEEGKGPTKDKEPTTSQPAAAEDEREEDKPEEKKDEPEKEEAKKEEDEKPKKPKRPERKPHLDVVLKALDREMPVRIAAHRSEDIFNALELAEEFSFDLTLEGASEAHLLAEQLAEAKVLVVLGNLARSSVPADDVYRRVEVDAAAVLSAAGVRCVVSSGAENPSGARFVALNAQLAAARSGRDNPLATVTSEAADALGIADQIGRLRPGLFADFVLWSGDPLDPTSEVRQVYVSGVPIFEATDEREKGETE